MRSWRELGSIGSEVRCLSHVAALLYIPNVCMSQQPSKWTFRNERLSCTHARKCKKCLSRRAKQINLTKYSTCSLHPQIKTCMNLYSTRTRIECNGSHRPNSHPFYNMLPIRATVAVSLKLAQDSCISRARQAYWWLSRASSSSACRPSPKHIVANTIKKHAVAHARLHGNMPQKLIWCHICEFVNHRKVAQPAHKRPAYPLKRSAVGRWPASRSSPSWSGCSCSLRLRYCNTLITFACQKTMMQSLIIGILQRPEINIPD